MKTNINMLQHTNLHPLEHIFIITCAKFMRRFWFNRPYLDTISLINLGLSHSSNKRKHGFELFFLFQIVWINLSPFLIKLKVTQIRHLTSFVRKMSDGFFNPKKGWLLIITNKGSTPYVKNIFYLLYYQWIIYTMKV